MIGSFAAGWLMIALGLAGVVFSRSRDGRLHRPFSHPTAWSERLAATMVIAAGGAVHLYHFSMAGAPLLMWSALGFGVLSLATGLVGNLRRTG